MRAIFEIDKHQIDRFDKSQRPHSARSSTILPSKPICLLVKQMMLQLRDVCEAENNNYNIFMKSNGNINSILHIKWQLTA